MKLTDQFESIFEKIAPISGLMHCNIFDNFSITHPVFIFIITDIILYVPINLYSIWYFSDQLLEVAFCITTVGFGIQGLTKLKVFIIDRNDIIGLRDDFYKFHRSNEKLDENIKNVLQAKQLVCIKCCDFIGHAYSIVGVAVIFLPIITAIWQQKYILPFGFILPFLEYETSPGYEINFAYQILKVFVVCTGLRCSDIVYIAFILNSCIQLETINQLVIKLNGIIDENKIIQRNNNEMKMILIDILKRHQNQLLLSRKLNDIFSLHFIIIILNIMMQIILILVVITFVTWYSGYFLLALSLSQLFIICALGTMYSIQCDKLEHYVYELKWYCFDIYDQKSILQLLIMAQNPVKQSVGGIRPLDLQTFLEVMKGIYSFFMMLINFI